jgi:hypothetical protein
MSQADRPLPFQPRGAVDGIVCDTTLAKNMSFSARWGSSCGTAFDKNNFFDEHIQWKRFRNWIVDRPSQPWTTFKSMNKITELKFKSLKINNNKNKKTIKLKKH